MFLNERTKTYSNIITSMKKQLDINPKMILHEEIADYKKNKVTEKKEPVYKYTLNVKFWKKVKKPINVVLDEAHSIINSRRSMSKINVILTDWLALVRRIVGSQDEESGELVLITQLPNRIDSIARDMATQVRFHKCHYYKGCLNCNLVWYEHNDMPEKIWICPSCESTFIKKFNHWIEIWKFSSMMKYKAWSEFGYMGEKGKRPYYAHFFINDIQDYFPLYSTLQWDNLFSQFYS